uniref:CAP-Gly domain-containing protein n=1 Tax=Chrysemys picta bellii TaxID=8478 RepID=A0A8C3HDN3_CHRPI
GNELLSSDIFGDRVLVKHIQPGTLMFKGCTSFDEGYWAGVALDKPEGDHDGTYGGVKYFVCAKYFGIFVRPDQISHLLEDNEKKKANDFVTVLNKHWPVETRGLICLYMIC